MTANSGIKPESRLANLALYTGVGTLFTHELDAMPNHEWRVLPATSWLPDDLGMVVFVLAHIPLFALVIGMLASLAPVVRRRTRSAVAAFLVLHAGLHWLFSGHEQYEFGSTMSLFLIGFSAVLGVVFLALEHLFKGSD